MKKPLHAVCDERARSSQMTAFARYLETTAGRAIEDYAALHTYSIDDIESFWRHFVGWSNIAMSGDPSPACEGTGVETARFFPNLRLSWTENLLGPSVSDDAIALIARDEKGGRAELSWGGLRRRVRAVAAGLEARGIGAGDRVAAVVRNTIDTVVACLAVTSLGAAWAAVAPDMGADAALSRFRQIAPKLLFTHAGASSNGVWVPVPCLAVAQGLSSLEGLAAMEDGAPPLGSDSRLYQTTLLELENSGARGREPDAAFRRFDFDHPLFVLFSSGTTGAPKCIVHGHGGTLLEHLKEHRLHGDVSPRDRLLFHTSTGWMMWNWTVSALATGSTVVLYDGSVSYPERDALLRIAAEERVTLLGTSPAYLQYLVDAGAAGRGSPRCSERAPLIFNTSSTRAPPVEAPSSGRCEKCFLRARSCRHTFTGGQRKIWPTSRCSRYPGERTFWVASCSGIHGRPPTKERAAASDSVSMSARGAPRARRGSVAANSSAPSRFLRGPSDSSQTLTAGSFTTRISRSMRGSGPTEISSS